jgi:antitoxin (DNA-binding transcriptional repressor) of toxin-antitoxin stability system
MPAISNRSRRSRAIVGTFHAKTHFSQLLERVAKGEEITITKHDRPVARLVPAERPSREHVAAIFRQMDALRRSLPRSKDKTGLKDLIHRGRRF